MKARPNQPCEMGSGMHKCIFASLLPFASLRLCSAIHQLRRVLRTFSRSADKAVRAPLVAAWPRYAFALRNIWLSFLRVNVHVAIGGFARPAQSYPLALTRITAYLGCAVKQPRINVEKKIERTKPPDGLSTPASSIAESIARRKAFGGVGVPKGVYRFKTHEEADEWLTRMLARPK